MAVTYATQHNGGRVQIGLADLFLGADFPFIDFLKGADGVFQVGGGVPDPTTFDVNGFPTSVTGGGSGWFFFIPPAADISGEDIIIDMVGNGTIALGGGVSRTYVSGSLMSSGTGQYRFTPSGAGETLSIIVTSLGTPHISRIRCYLSSEASRLAAGEIFGTKFMNRMLNELKPGVIRDLDWAQGNVNCVTKVSDLKPVGYAYYKGAEYRGEWWGGNATLSGKIYSVSTPSGFGTLSNKNIVQFKVQNNAPVVTLENPTFTNGSANITATGHTMAVGEAFFLKSDSGVLPGGFETGRFRPIYVKTVVGGTITASLTPGGAVIVCGAVPGTNIYLSPCVYLKVGSDAPIIMMSHGWPMISGDNTYPAAGKVGTAVYESTIGCYLLYGGDGAYGDRGMCNGGPIEPFLQLCAQVGAHPHLVKEGMASFPESNVTTFKASIIRDIYNGDSSKLCPWMRPVFEATNEVWNNGPDFFTTHYAYSLAAALGEGWDIHQVYGMWLSTLAQAVNVVYSNDQTKFFIGCGVQNAGNGDVGWDPRITVSKWIEASAPIQPGYTIASAKNYGTVVVLTTSYWRPSYYGDSGTPTEAAMVAQWAAATDPNVKSQILEDYVANTWINPSAYSFDLNGMTTIYWPNWKAYAIRNGVTRVRMYEGGVDLIYGGSTETKEFRNAAKGTQAAAAVEMAIMNNFCNLSGSGVTFEYPSVFLLSDGNREGTPKGHAWGLFNGGATIYGPVTPRYTAVCNWSGGKRAPNLRLRWHS